MLTARPDCYELFWYRRVSKWDHENMGHLNDVVLANGTIVKTRCRPRKSSAGYDLTNLMVGSEGTLGLVTEAVLKVNSTPRNRYVIVAAFPDTQLAVKTAVTPIGSGLPIDALELLDKHSMWALNQFSLSLKQWRESPTLFSKISGL
ncbi:hypothetical protein N7G274_001261 [Stereocaulon virgatum]|uniref:Uncharacterized protein n=1 Tax=Stereocaulon virgatum TaxID=373712 RepID=A0ABR4ANC6_9LECA